MLPLWQLQVLVDDFDQFWLQVVHALRLVQAAQPKEH